MAGYTPWLMVAVFLTVGAVTAYKLAIAIQTQEVRLYGRSAKRAEDPISYWIIVIQYALALPLMAVGLFGVGHFFL